MAVEVGVNTKVPHFENNIIFCSTKYKLKLLPNDNSDSHHHDCINFTILKLKKGILLA